MADTGVGEGRGEGVDRVRQVPARREDELVAVRRSRTRLLFAADADRRAIERALHDGLQQLLVVLAADVRRAGGLVDADPPAAKASLDDVAALLREAIGEAARLAQWIYPPRLQDMRGLASALRAVADRLGVALTIEVSTAADVAPETVAGIYWCCAEALAAAAPAGTQATVGVGEAEGGIRFAVGVVGAYSAGELERMRDRVEALGGRLSVEDEGDDRLRVEGWVPSVWS